MRSRLAENRDHGNHGSGDNDGNNDGVERCSGGWLVAWLLVTDVWRYIKLVEDGARTYGGRRGNTTHGTAWEKMQRNSEGAGSGSGLHSLCCGNTSVRGTCRQRVPACLYLRLSSDGGPIALWPRTSSGHVSHRNSHTHFIHPPIHLPIPSACPPVNWCRMEERQPWQACSSRD